MEGKTTDWQSERELDFRTDQFIDQLLQPVKLYDHEEDEFDSQDEWDRYGVGERPPTPPPEPYVRSWEQLDDPEVKKYAVLMSTHQKGVGDRSTVFRSVHPESIRSIFCVTPPILAGSSVSTSGMKQSCVQLKPGDVFADLGCGTGLIVAQIAVCYPFIKKAIGVDIRADLLDDETLEAASELTEWSTAVTEKRPSWEPAQYELFVGDLTDPATTWLDPQMDLIKANILFIHDDAMHEALNEKGTKGASVFQKIFRAYGLASYRSLILPHKPVTLITTYESANEIIPLRLAGDPPTPFTARREGLAGQVRPLLGYASRKSAPAIVYRIHQERSYWYGSAYFEYWHGPVVRAASESRPFHRETFPVYPSTGLTGTPILFMGCNEPGQRCHYCLSPFFKSPANERVTCANCQEVEYCSERCLELDLGNHGNRMECWILKLFHRGICSRLVPGLRNGEAGRTATQLYRTVTRFLTLQIALATAPFKPNFLSDSDSDFTGEIKAISSPDLIRLNDHGILALCGRAMKTNDPDSMELISETENDPILRIVTDMVLLTYPSNFIRTLAQVNAAPEFPLQDPVQLDQVEAGLVNLLTKIEFGMSQSKTDEAKLQAITTASADMNWIGSLLRRGRSVDIHPELKRFEEPRVTCTVYFPNRIL